MKNLLFRISLIAPLLAAPMAAAEAQTSTSDETTILADELIECAGLTDKNERLECYDTVAQPLLGLEGTGQAKGPDALHSFTGKGDWDSKVLELEQNWRVTWQNQGSLLTVELHDSAGQLLNVIGNQIGRGGGRSEVIGPGSYQLAVRGTGGWRVQTVVSEENVEEN